METPSSIANIPHPEVLLTGDSTGQMWNLCAWDPLSGAALTTFKGASTAANTLTFLSDELIISAQPKKPLLNIWQINRHEQQPDKLVVPGPVTALAASQSGKFLVCAVGDKMFVWQTCNGVLHRVLSKCGHYQDITVIKFTDDGSHFVSAGKDGNVLVWNLLEVISKHHLPGQAADRTDAPVAKHSHSDHKMPVTGLHLSEGGIRARIFTSSLDHTCKVYNLADGRMLLDVSFAVRLTSVAVDFGQSSVYLGSAKGTIHTFGLLSPPRDLKVTMEKDESNTFGGRHSDEVTCLSASLDGLTIASGSLDQDVRLWHVKSRQCLRTVGHKGPITVVKFLAPPRTMLEPDTFQPGLVLTHQLQRSVEANKSDVKINVHVRERVHPTVADDDCMSGVVALDLDTKEGDSRRQSNGVATEEVQKLREANLELYRYAVRNILNGNS